MSQHSFTPRRHPLAQTIGIILATSIPLYATAADTVDIKLLNEPLPETELETIMVTAKTQPDTQNKDVTGLGQINKTAETLKRSQVENIRDLTRYDAGVAVNESVGRGTSTGFSIRGAEKERVAVMVDGISQGETIKRYGNGSGTESGAKNEVEYENLKLVEINKGANSTYAGSGALGGAVLMQTKDTIDFVDENDNFGGRIKLGYTSRDKRKVASAALGGRTGGWEGFVQYTKRSGHELQPHSDMYNLPGQTVEDVIVGVEPVQEKRTGINADNKPFTYNFLSWKPITQTQNFSTEDVSGPNRRVPNPMDYDSDSLLSKIGYHINNEHYLGTVLEDTKQQYDIRDMFSYNYHSNKIANSNDLKIIKPEVLDHFSPEPFYAYTPTRFLTDTHHNRRYGLEYKYTPSESAVFDEVHTRIDKQKLTLSSEDQRINCATYPNTNKDCEVEKYGQFKSNRYIELDFDTKRFDMNAKKDFKLGDTSHQLVLNAGYTKAKLQEKNSGSKKFIGTKSNSSQPELNTNGYDKYYPILSETVEKPYGLNKIGSPVHQKSYFVGINDTFMLDEDLGATLGLRYDNYKFNSDQGIKEFADGRKVERFTDSEFNNTSWNLGLIYYPTDDIELMYKYSTGFRVPSMTEQLGFTPNDDSSLPQPKLEPETAQNHEIGAAWHTRFGDLKASYFRTDYRDFIAFGIPVSDVTQLAYYNQQDVKVHGFDLSSELDLKAIWDKAPLGLQANLSAGLVKMRETPERNPNYQSTRSYAFDMVQPLRVIYGVSYNEPNDKWGVALNTTYSAAKDVDELNYSYQTGGLSGEDTTADLTAPSWRITDLTGHYRINDNLTLRGGIYNIFDYGYLTWESLRQLKDLQDVNSADIKPQLLAAPGRNYGLSMEFTF